MAKTIRSAAPPEAVEAAKQVGRAPVLKGPVLTRSQGTRGRFTPAEQHYSGEPENGCDHGLGDARWCGICKHGPGDDQWPDESGKYPRKKDVRTDALKTRLPTSRTGANPNIYLPLGSRESVRARNPRKKY